MANTTKKPIKSASKNQKALGKKGTQTISAKIAKPQAKKTKISLFSEIIKTCRAKANFIKKPLITSKPPKVVYLALAIIALALLFTYKKSWLVAATVNGAPITNFEVLSKLNKQYRTQTLNQMINEKIILEEANKKKVVVKDSEINERLTALEKNVGGKEILDNLLTQQGQTRESLKDQLKIQLTIEKLYENEASVSAKEIDEFITQNKGQLQATDSAGQVKEARDFLKQQKLANIFQEKFQQLKAAAQIKIF